MSTTKVKNSVGAGLFSVCIMSSLTYLGVYSVQTVNDPSHYEMCSTGGPATWALYNFYASAIGGLIAAVYELYLVVIGKVFEEETIPIVPKIRAFNAGYIFTVGLIFDTFMVIGTGKSGLLNKFVFFLGIVGVINAPGMAFPKTPGQTVAQGFFFGSTVLSMILIFFRGAAFGGAKTTYYLALNKASSAFGLILTPPNISLRNNIQFHILRLIANILVISAYLNATAESPCFPQEAESLISSMFMPLLLLAGVGGWVFHLSVNNKSSEKTKAT